MVKLRLIMSCAKRPFIITFLSHSKTVYFPAFKITCKQRVKSSLFNTCKKVWVWSLACRSFDKPTFGDGQIFGVSVCVVNDKWSLALSALSVCPPLDRKTYRREGSVDPHFYGGAPPGRGRNNRGTRPGMDVDRTKRSDILWLFPEICGIRRWLDKPCYVI